MILYGTIRPRPVPLCTCTRMLSAHKITTKTMPSQDQGPLPPCPGYTHGADRWYINAYTDLPPGSPQPTIKGLTPITGPT